MKTIYCQLAAIVAVTLSGLSVNAQTVSTFEFTTLPPDSFWNGSSAPMGTTFSSGNAIFHNYYDTAWGGIWSTGWAYANVVDTTTAGFGNLYAASAGKGYNGSLSWAIGQQNARVALDSNAAGKVVEGFYVTNGTYAYLSMRDGDGFAKKFGGPTGNDTDWFKLTIRAWYQGSMIGDSVEFYLADYRFGDNAHDYILTEWEWVDLTSLGNVDSLRFELTSSDVGSFGMNTPAFFCIDDFTTGDRELAIPDWMTASGISIYPNPVQSILHFNLDDRSKTINRVEIRDVTGALRVSKSVAGYVHEIDVSDLGPDVYMVTLHTASEIVTKRIVKQ